MNRIANFVFMLLALGLFATNASANWSDDFDTYATGSGLIGQGGWEGWGGGDTDAIISNAYAHSAPNSVGMLPTTDVVQQFSIYNTGLVTISAWLYYPITATGARYFNLFDFYDHSTGYCHGSLILKFVGGQLVCDGDNVEYPIDVNQWAELRVQIDLDSDNVKVFYSGAMILNRPWTAWGGVLNIACLDLFSLNGSAVYWDDITLVWQTTGVEDTSWSQVKALY